MLLKKVLAALLLPLPFAVFLLLAGLMLRQGTPGQRRRRLATTSIWAGMVLLVVAGSPWFGNSALAFIEQHYQPLLQPAADTRYVVVLSSSARNDPWRIGADRLDSASLRRVEEGVRLLAQHPDALLVLSGGGLGDDPVAPEMAAWARAQGVPDSRMVLELASRDTHDQAVALSGLLQDQPSVLVTSASHMPRALAMFRAQGVMATAAPTDYRASTDPGGNWYYRLLPNAAGLEQSTRASYEVMGLIWSGLRGQLQFSDERDSG